MRLPLTRGASRSTPRVRSFAALVVTVLAFMIVGSAAGPRWNPEPLTTTLDVATSSVAVGPVGTPDPVGTYEVSRRTVQVQLDGYVTDVLIVEPVGLSQPAPAVVFVHGCFWHGHTCRYFRWPASRPEFWRAKIGRNQFNDAAALDALQQMGWRVAVVWECAMRGKSVQDVNDLGAAVGAWLASDAVSLVLPVELS